MRYTKSALGLLNAQYRSVLNKCLLINLGLFVVLSTPAYADDTVRVLTGVSTTTVDNVVQATGSDLTATGKTSITAVAATQTQTADVYTTTKVDSLVNAKQNTIDDGNKLSADLIQDGTTNKVSTWNAVATAVNDSTNGLASKTTLATVVSEAEKSDAGTLGAAIDSKITAKLGTVSDAVARNAAAITDIQDGYDFTGAISSTGNITTANGQVSGATVNVGGTSGATLSLASGKLSSDKAIVSSNGFEVSDTNKLTSSGLTASAATIGGDASITGSLTTTGAANLNGGINVNSGKFTVGTDGAITGLGLKTDATNGVDLGIEGKTTDIIGETINMGDNATTAVNIGTGTAANTIAIGSSHTTKAEMTAGNNKVTVDANGTTVTGNATVKGTFGAGSNGTQFTVDGDGNTDIAGSLKVGSTDQFQVGTNGAVSTTGTLTADGESKFGKVGTTYALDVKTDAVTANKVVEAKEGVKFGDDGTAMTSASHSGAIAAGATDQGAVVASTQTIADTRAAINTEANEVLGGVYKINTDGTVDYNNNALAGNGFQKGTGANLTAQLNDYAADVANATGLTFNESTGANETSYAAHTAIAVYTANIKGTSLKAAIDKIDNAIGDAMIVTGGSRATTAFQTGASKSVNANLSALDAAIGADMTSVQTRTTGAVAATNTINTNLQQLDAAIGSNADLLTTTVSTNTGDNNGVKVDNSVNRNIAALNAAVGDVSTLKAGTAATGDAITKGTGTAATTVVEAINNIDATLGNIHGLYDGSTVNASVVTSTVNGHSNLAKGTTVEDHLVTLDNAVGDRTLTSLNNDIDTAMSGTSLAAGLQAAGNAIGDANFASTKYASGDRDLSSAIRSLDNNIYRIDREVSDLKHDFRAGMASMAAMTALVPNARSQGDTSLSLGTGAYEGHTAMAIGGFHYINDNLLLNAGISWSNTSDAAYRMGITYSF